MTPFYQIYGRVNGSVRLAFYDEILDEIEIPVSQLFNILQNRVN